MVSLRRALSRKSSSKSAALSESQDRPPVPRLPSFRDSRYEDALQGAQPVVGLLPLRGNRMFAVRHEAVPRPPHMAGSVDSGAADQDELWPLEDVGPTHAPVRTSADGGAMQHVYEPEHVPTLRPKSLDHEPNFSRIRKLDHRWKRDDTSQDMRRSADGGTWNNRRGLSTRRPAVKDFEGPGILVKDHKEGSRREKSVSFAGAVPTGDNLASSSTVPPSADDVVIGLATSQPTSPGSVASWSTAREEADEPSSIKSHDMQHPSGFPHEARSDPPQDFTHQSKPQDWDEPDEHDSGISVGSHASESIPVAETFSSHNRISPLHTDKIETTTERLDSAPLTITKGKWKTSSIPSTSQGASPASEVASQEVLRRAGYDSTDTTVYQSVAPAVTHETITNEIHHIREQRIFREIHNHDVYHRILPIIDVEVLPTRHFKVQGSELVEMQPHEIPKGREYNWVVAETVSTGETSTKPRGFTAREFPGTEGDDVTYMTREGFPRTETTWVHPPELEPGGYETGQTVRFDL